MPKTFDEELYKNKSINDLILFGIYSLSERRKKCIFEKLVKECFALFPETFCFSGYPKWPDSRKLDRPLRTLRKRKLIAGNPKTSFSLTKRGEKKVLEIAKFFQQKKLL